MNIIEAVILGVLQGLTEFLPVSSSGHLALSERFLGIKEPSLFFSIMLHIGTLGAVVIVLWDEVSALLKKPFQKTTLNIIIATLPAVAAALLFNDTLDALFTGSFFLGPAFLITSAALLISDIVSRSKKTTAKKSLTKITVLDALIVGIFQAIAILPGVSRSGLTLTSGLLRNIERGGAARFSFLISIPAILGALVLELWKMRGSAMTVDALPIICGTVTAFATGLLSIKLMLKIVREKRLFGFAIYTALLAILCFII